MLDRDEIESIYWDGILKTATCWLWIGWTTESGYGSTYESGKHQYMHRIAYEKAFGPIPRGMHVLHSCDVRHCVNPEHLFLGTQQDNLRDMVTKRRHARGVRHGHCKLTEENVRKVWVLKSEGIVQGKIAETLGVSQSTISEILSGKRWTHLRSNDDIITIPIDITPAIIDEAIKLRSQGMTLKAIARTIGIGYGTTQRICVHEHHLQKSKS